MDESFVETAMDTYGNTVLRTAVSVTGNRADAEDVFSDVFFLLYKIKMAFVSENHLKAWLIRVTVNKSKNVRNSARSRLREEFSDNIAAPQDYADNDVLDALQMLNSKDRAVIYLHYYEGYMFKEIAQMLNMREGSIRSIASRARTELKQMLFDNN